MGDEMNKINDESLGNVVGGAKRIVENDAVGYANVREAPGLNSKVLYKLPNGSDVYTTGNKITRDGYTWYELYSDEYNYVWIAGSLIGY